MNVSAKYITLSGTFLNPIQNFKIVQSQRREMTLVSLVSIKAPQITVHFGNRMVSWKRSKIKNLQHQGCLYEMTANSNKSFDSSNAPIDP
jgi:hypothetical protein